MGLSDRMKEVAMEATQKEKNTVKKNEAALEIPSEFERLSLGIDVGTSHCEVVAYGKRADKYDEEKYHFSQKPLAIRCWSSLILFAKNNESSTNYVLKFQEDYKLPKQEEYIDGEKVPYIF